MNTDRREQQRLEKLAEVKRQVESGSLVIRKLTDAEREDNPPRPREEKPGKGRGGRRKHTQVTGSCAATRSGPTKRWRLWPPRSTAFAPRPDATGGA